MLPKFNYSNVFFNGLGGSTSPRSSSDERGKNAIHDSADREAEESDQRTALIDSPGQDIAYEDSYRCLDDHQSQTTTINAVSYERDINGARKNFDDGPLERSDPTSTSLSGTSTIQSNPTHYHIRYFDCTTRERITRNRAASIAVICVGFAAFAGSFLYMYAAFKKPDWSDKINTDGGLSPTTASLLCTLIAKVIEMAFVTVVVASIGQHLSHRAIGNQSGITIADLSMRNWALQPGTVFTQFRSVRHSAPTVAGLFTISATLGAMFYTTAAEALVSPKITMGRHKYYDISAMVATKFANVSYIEQHCTVPGSNYPDKNGSCYQLMNVGQSYHNYQGWLSAWNRTGPQPMDLKYRPPPTGLFMENTTVRGTWLEEPKSWTMNYPNDRLINSVTYAFPHAGIFSAAVNPVNKIRPPSFFDNSSKFDLQATTASPVMNVLCAGVSEDELAPLVYSTWPSNTFNGTTFQALDSRKLVNKLYPQGARNATNSTSIDQIFGWGNSPDDALRPIFGKFALPSQTLINVAAYGLEGTYLLAGVPNELKGVGSSQVLCRMRATMGSGCSTTYHAESSGGELYTTCDETDELRYKGPSLEEVVWDLDWANMGNDWSQSVSLSNGVMNTPAANPAVLTHLISNDSSRPLPADRPSIAEALAVMAGSTLLLATQNASLFHAWTYQPDEVPVNYKTTARLQGTIMQSGGQVQSWQKTLFASLVVVCLLSLACCFYLLVELLAQHITDFTEPQNMFALALNSPPCHELDGACGVGPSKAQLRQGWSIDLEDALQHYFLRPAHERNRASKVGTGGATQVASTHSLPRPEVAKEFESLRKRESLLGRLSFTKRV
ncbi:hypothetical protein KEM54_004250 [Ascosphaera aggregata]|nr:hypothetical protein KEM54_004250 [Ascosphaera aggregata]